MTIKEIAELITTKKYWFQVSIPDTNFSHGRTNIETALSDCDSLESYLNRIIDTNKAKALFIRLYTPNGGKGYSSFTERDAQLILLPSTKPVENQSETSQKPVGNQSETSQKPIENQSETSCKPVEKPVGNHFEAQKQPIQHPKNTPMNDKDYIDFKVLQSEHKRLEHYYDESKSKIKKLETKVEELHEDNKKLLRDNSTKEDKHEIALERVKMEMEKESKDGLSGVVDFANNNPETIKMLLGALFPNNPNFKQSATEQPALEGAPDNNREIKYTEDSQANALLNDIPRVLSQKDGNTMAQIYLLFQEFVAKPEILEKAVETFLPTYQS